MWSSYERPVGFSHDERREKTLYAVADFFDCLRVGYAGNSGYRKTTDLSVFLTVARSLIARGLINPDETVFLDLGSGDGRVSMLMGYLCRYSIGIEVEDFIYDDYLARRRELEWYLSSHGLLPISPRVIVVRGDSLDEETYEHIEKETGISFRDVHLFYTYITLHDVFARLVEEKAREGALYMVYGFSGILPRYEGLELLDADVANQHIVSLYRKGGGR